MAEDFKIFVNGKEKKDIRTPELSFDDLVKLAFPTPPTGTRVIFTIIYRDGPPANPEGSLVPGEKVKIRNGMIFDVTATTES